MTIDPTKLTGALIAADDAFRADHKVVFGTEGDRLKGFFAARARRFKDWDRSGPCLFRGCSEPSIARSHALQRSHVLERIAEAGHVMTPQVDDAGRVVMRKIGIGLASTFPGFCEQHEQLFAGFETGGVITDPRHLGLQMMRTVCREIARVRLAITHLGSVLNEYRAARRDYFAKALLGADGAAALRAMAIEGDAMDDRAASELREQHATLKVLEGALYREVMDYVSKGRPQPACVGILLPSDDPVRGAIDLPVAMSGFAFINYTDGKQTHRAPYTLSVIPQAGATLIIIGTVRKHKRLLSLVKPRFETICSLLNSLESWMVHGTDHWFIRPSVWNALPVGRQAAICDGIASAEGAPMLSPAPSIFDDMRKMALAELEPNLPSRPAADRTAEAAILAAKKAKLGG